MGLNLTIRKLQIKKIEFLIRPLIPNFLKKIFKISREFFLSYENINEEINFLKIDQVLLEDCLFCENRKTMLNFLPNNSVVAELGTFKGNFAKHIIERTTPLELHLCDVDFTKFKNENILDCKSVTKHKKTTLEFLESFKEEFFDWIYIDAGHEFNDVLNDINSAKNKVKEGGYLVFNDFAHINPTLGRFGVMRAVSEFVNKERWKIKYFAFNRLALYDIAIQRPIKNKK